MLNKEQILEQIRTLDVAKLDRGDKAFLIVRVRPAYRRLLRILAYFQQRHMQEVLGMIVTDFIKKVALLDEPSELSGLRITTDFISLVRSAIAEDEGPSNGSD